MDARLQQISPEEVAKLSFKEIDEGVIIIGEECNLVVHCWLTPSFKIMGYQVVAFAAHPIAGWPRWQSLRVLVEDIQVRIKGAKFYRVKSK